MPGPKASIQFQPIEQVRAHEYVAEQIRRQIALHLISPGQALPPERELARMFGVSRKTVQDAVHVLEVDRLIESRRGRSGGNFVIAPVEQDHSFERLLGRIRQQRPVIEEVLAFRGELEPAAAARAAAVGDPGSLSRLREAARLASEAVTDAAFIEHDTEFHLTIGRATQNRFFSESIEQVRVLLSDVLMALPESDVWQERTTREHAAVLRAVEAGDASAARKAMRTHVAHTEQSIRALLAAL
ncbi:MAG: FadR/GntR family transcriptional regulator [Gaiellales bacterium]